MIRAGELDVAVVAGPGIGVWPTPGARELTALLARGGLETGLYGGGELRPVGVLPGEGSGGALIAEDVRGRTHRVRARSIVRLAAPAAFGAPFAGAHGEGLLPERTVRRLLREAGMRWEPGVAILGGGQRGYLLGIRFLERVRPGEVTIVAGAEPTDAWAVLVRRFAALGGRVVVGEPLELLREGAGRWLLRVQDAQGTRRLEIARAVSAPAGAPTPPREHPPGSLLFEIEASALAEREDDPRGWDAELVSARAVGARILRTLRSAGAAAQALAPGERAGTGARRPVAAGAAVSLRHEGKWLARESMAAVRAFSGVPGGAALARGGKPLPAIECFEPIECDLCERSCPEQAIALAERFGPGRVLDTDRCTGCGACVAVCPASAITLLEEAGAVSVSWRSPDPAPPPRASVALVNRRGERLGAARVLAPGPVAGTERGLVRVEAPAHLLWEARGIAVEARRGEDAAPEFLSYLGRGGAGGDERGSRVPISLEGETRWWQDGQNLAVAFFEHGLARPQDRLLCVDGSCRLCWVEIDGQKRQACQERVRAGAHLKWLERDEHSWHGGPEVLCPCVGVARDSLDQRGATPESWLRRTGCGEGRCRGQVCGAAARRELAPPDQWLDWRFPWREWSVGKT